MLRAPSSCAVTFVASGYCSLPTRWYKFDFGFDGLPVDVSGETDNSGRIDGVADGQMTLWELGFPCDRAEWCQTRFSWTLLPK